MSVKIYGSSDDLIIVEGDITVEFNAYSTQDECLFLSNGLAFSVEYNGLWKFQLIRGDGRFINYTHIATDSNSKKYSDVIEIKGTITWAGLGILGE